MIYVTSTQRRLTLSIGLLASVGDVRAMPARLPGYAPDTSFVNFHVTEITCPAPWDCQPRSVTRTTCDDLRHQHPAPPHSAPISSLPPRSASIGHGGTGEMTVTNPFVFIVQVRRQYDYCIRSGDPFLLVLPCPRLCCAFASVLLFLRKLLLLAGDIESNPGPDLAQIAKQLKEVAVDIKEIKEGRLADMDKKLDALSRLEPKITSCVKQIEDMHLITKNLEKRMDDLENQSRRSNIIVYGLAETEQENSEKLEQAVNKGIVQDILGLQPVTIERIHRLGKPAQNKTRPVMLRLLDSRQKSIILREGRKLKNTGLSIGEDFCKRTREIRRLLWNSAKANREHHDKVSLSLDKLYINDQVFTWDEGKGERVPLRKNAEAKRPNTRSKTQPRN
nr:uncharacterized protein LOC119175631 [Rhipicephalus microplus]